MSNPYQKLGVDKTADSETIRRAHRRAAKETHPDVGGDENEFRAINEAYLVLSDPIRRQRFDMIGETAPPRDTVVIELVKLFISACEQNPDGNPMKMVEDIILGNLLRMKKEETNALTAAAKLHRMVKRIKVKQGRENLLSHALDGRARDLERQANAYAEGLTNGERMLELLADYDFEMPPPPKEQSTPWQKARVADFSYF